MKAIAFFCELRSFVKATDFVRMSGMSDNDSRDGYTDDYYDGYDFSPSSSSMDAFDYVNPNPGSFNMKVYGTSSPILLEKKQRADRYAATSVDRIPEYEAEPVLPWGWDCTSCSKKVDKQPRRYENGVEPVGWWWCQNCRDSGGKGGGAHSRTGLKEKDDTPRVTVKDTKKPTSAPTKTQKKKEDTPARCEKNQIPDDRTFQKLMCVLLKLLHRELISFQVFLCGVCVIHNRTHKGCGGGRARLCG